VKISTVFLPLFILFLLSTARITWSPIDVEWAAVQAARTGSVVVDHGLFTGKATLLGLFAGGLLFAPMFGNPLKLLGLFPCMLYVMAVASVAWSFSPPATLFTALQLTLVIGYPVLACRILGYQRTLRTVWLVSAAIILASIALSLVHDPHTMMGGLHEGLWRGLFGHKNAFGPFLVIHILLTLFARREMGMPRLLMWPTLLIDAGTLGMAESVTAVLAGASGLLAGVVALPIRHRGLRMIVRWGCIAAIGAFVVLVAGGSDIVLQAFGRDATMSNRTILWDTALDFANLHRLGTGYGTGGGSQVVTALQERTTSHVALGVQSGYLNLALELGWGAVALFALWMLTLLLAQVVSSRLGGTSAFFAALIVQHAVESIGESSGCIYPSWGLAMLFIVMIGSRMTRQQALPLFGGAEAPPAGRGWTKGQKGRPGPTAAFLF
jgi:hypothetical protein